MPDDNLEFYADRSQMEQLFLNLLKNGCEACAGNNDPEVIVAAVKKGNDIVFSVRDNGVGVESENGKGACFFVCL